MPIPGPRGRSRKDVGERDLGKSCGLQDVLHGRRVGKRERIRSHGGRRHGPFVCSEGLVNGDVPFVLLVGLPDHHRQAPGRAQRSPDVDERVDGVVEEHRAEPADRQVEVLLRKGVDLRVGLLEGDVAESFSAGEFPGALDRRRRDVDPERTPCLRRASGLSSRLPGPAADVEDVVVELDANRQAQYLVVPPQFGVEADAAGRMFACDMGSRHSTIQSAAVDRRRHRLAVLCPASAPNGYGRWTCGLGY